MSTLDEELQKIGDAANEVLPEDYGIMGVLYRFVDAGVFGKKGWSIEIGCPTPIAKWGLGHTFRELPTKEEVQIQVRDMISKIEAARNKEVLSNLMHGNKDMMHDGMKEHKGGHSGSMSNVKTVGTMMGGKGPMKTGNNAMPKGKKPKKG